MTLQSIMHTPDILGLFANDQYQVRAKVTFLHDNKYLTRGPLNKFRLSPKGLQAIGATDPES